MCYKLTEWYDQHNDLIAFFEVHVKIINLQHTSFLVHVSWIHQILCKGMFSDVNIMHTFIGHCDLSLMEKGKVNQILSMDTFYEVNVLPLWVTLIYIWHFTYITE